MQSVRKNSGKRGNTWTAVVEAGRDPVSGRRKQLKKTFRTRAEAVNWRTKTLHELNTGAYIEAAKDALDVYLSNWLITIRPTVKPATYERYRQIVSGHLIPVLGAVPLAKLSPVHIQQLYASKLAEGLSPSTVSIYYQVLHRALEQAVKWQMLYRNPCDGVDAPRPVDMEMKTWNAEQVRAFLVGSSEDSLCALWRLAVTTGMRRGEMLALRWADVDLDRGEIYVRRTLTRGEHGLMFGEPKSAKGKRSIAITQSSVAELQKHCRRQAERRLQVGPLWDDTDLVFERGNGRVLHGNVVGNRFRNLTKKLGLPRIRFHDLRHTAATLMLANGEHPKIVQERLGHSDISMTLNKYSHVTMGMQRDAADRLDAMLGS